VKIISYSFFCFIFCFLGLCDDEEDKCTKLEKEITITIYSNMYVSIYADYQEACEYAYAIDFYKEHCGGDLSKPMSYTYQGCYEKNGTNYVQRNFIFLWDVTFNYEEDILHVNAVDSRHQGQIRKISITGKEIYEYTRGGLYDILIVGEIHDVRIVLMYFETTTQNPNQ
jgi:hypothetical protein